MNTGDFNSHAINASAQNSVVRTSVVGFAYANARAEARVWRKSPQVHLAEARVTLLAHALMRSPVVGLAQAVTTLTVRALVRSLVAATMRAQQVVISNRVRMRLQTVASALIDVKARVLRRSPASHAAEVVQQVTLIRLARSPVDATLRADGVVTGLVLMRTFFRTVLNALLRAEGVATGLVLRRSVVDSQALAQGDLQARVLRRSIVQGQARAVGYVGGSSYIRYEFDEPATDDNSFTVPFEDNVFYMR